MYNIVHYCDESPHSLTVHKPTVKKARAVLPLKTYFFYTKLAPTGVNKN